MLDEWELHHAACAKAHLQRRQPRVAPSALAADHPLRRRSLSLGRATSTTAAPARAARVHDNRLKGPLPPIWTPGGSAAANSNCPEGLPPPFSIHTWVLAIRVELQAGRGRGEQSVARRKDDARRGERDRKRRSQIGMSSSGVFFWKSPSRIFSKYSFIGTARFSHPRTKRWTELLRPSRLPNQTRPKRSS
jgi:hypothetical protein